MRRSRPAPLWRGDDGADLARLFDARWAGGNDPHAMAFPTRADRRRERARTREEDAIEQWRLRIATAEAYGHRRTA